MEQEEALRRALESIEAPVLTRFATGNVFTEMDLQYAILDHLRATLAAEDPRWTFLSNCTIHESRPDIACCYREADVGPFLEDPEDSVRGLVEIKVWNDLGDDLGKLKRLQKWFNRNYERRPLAWMVYADHFSPDIHKSNHRAQRKREARIERWVEKRAESRGRSILRLGGRAPDLPEHAAALEKLDGLFWDRDRSAAEE